MKLPIKFMQETRDTIVRLLSHLNLNFGKFRPSCPEPWRPKQQAPLYTLVHGKIHIKQQTGDLSSDPRLLTDYGSLYA